MATNALIAGTISAGAITSTSHNMATNALIAGTISAGAITSTTINMATNALNSGSISVGTITSSDVTSGNITSTSISPLQYVETIVSLTYAASVSTSFTSGTLYVFNSGTASPITTLAITNVPTTSNRSYTMTFILPTTNSANYITATTISVNGTSYALKGTINASTPSLYIVQQISIFNIGGTFTAITSATFF